MTLGLAERKVETAPVKTEKLLNVTMFIFKRSSGFPANIKDVW